MENELKFSVSPIKLEEAISRTGCYDMVEENGIIWFWWFNANGLCQFDSATKSVDIIAQYENAPNEKRDLYRAIKKIGNKLVLAPRAAKEIAIYDMELKEMRYLGLADVQDCRKEKYDENYKFVVSLRHRNTVYLLGYRYPAIVKIDLETSKVTYLTAWVDEIESRMKNESDMRGYLIHAIASDEEAWIACGNTNALLRLDFKTDEISVIDIPCRMDGFGGIAWANENFWLVGRGKESNIIVRWNARSAETKEIEIFSPAECKKSAPFHPPIVLRNKIMLFPISGKHVYEIDTIAERVTVCTVFDGLFDNEEINFCPHAVTGMCRTGEKIWFITGKDLLWNEYDCNTKTISRYEVKAQISTEPLKRMIASITDEVLRESKTNIPFGHKLSLSQFIRLLSVD
ncbi:MAG: hypothetical protein K2I96_07925 [Lachnospiraceae bacterium]|nr:hypothetical protein [Lachnospiraceae bacterium]